MSDIEHQKQEQQHLPQPNQAQINYENFQDSQYCDDQIQDKKSYSDFQVAEYRKFQQGSNLDKQSEYQRSNLYKQSEEWQSQSVPQTEQYYENNLQIQTNSQFIDPEQYQYREDNKQEGVQQHSQQLYYDEDNDHKETNLEAVTDNLQEIQKQIEYQEKYKPENENFLENCQNTTQNINNNATNVQQYQLLHNLQQEHADNIHDENQQIKEQNKPHLQQNLPVNLQKVAEPLPLQTKQLNENQQSELTSQKQGKENNSPQEKNKEKYTTTVVQKQVIVIPPYKQKQKKEEIKKVKQNNKQEMKNTITEKEKKQTNQQIKKVKQNNKQEIKNTTTENEIKKQKSVEQQKQKPATKNKKSKKKVVQAPIQIEQPSTKKQNEQVIYNEANNPIKQSPNNQSNIKQTLTNQPSPLQQQILIPLPVDKQLPLLIVKSAQKQRIANVLTLFNQYIAKFSKHLKQHQAVVCNVLLQIQRKTKMKSITSFLIRQYFNQIIEMSKQFRQKSYKFNYKVHTPNSILINMNQSFKTGLQQLVYVRKAIGNDYQKLKQFIQQKIIKSIVKVFTQYDCQMLIILNKVAAQKKEFETKQKEVKKRISKVNKLYKKIQQSPQQDDVFIEMSKYIQVEQQLIRSLVHWGQIELQMRHQYIALDNRLFEQVQKILNQFKNYMVTLYNEKQKTIFTKIQSLVNEIKSDNHFINLCTLLDQDYIKYVMKVDSKLKHTELGQKHIQQFVKFAYLRQYTGDSEQLLKGLQIKSFCLKNNKSLINTMSGNLIQYDKHMRKYDDKFVIKNINVKIVSPGTAQINELQKGFIFDSNRTIRLEFKTQDIAQQFLTLLSEEV